MDISRRSFLGGVIAVAGAALVPATPADALIPHIVGDGVHDDTAGLQAALDGKPFISDGFVVGDANEVYITNGRFLISGNLRAPPDTRVCMIGNYIQGAGPHAGLDLTADPRAVVGYNYFNAVNVQLPGLYAPPPFSGHQRRVAP